MSDVAQVPAGLLPPTSIERPDALRKASGRFAYSSDVWAERMVWGVTLRSPHPRARILSIDVSVAESLPGVLAVLTHRNVPGRKTFGLFVADQPVLASDQIRYVGEPIAIVAAEELHLAREALDQIVVAYEVLEPITDSGFALIPDTPKIHETGNLIRHFRIRKGDPEPDADVVIEGTYEIGMQDQAFLGPESALASPTADGGVEMHVSTQCLFEDLAQISASLDLPSEKIHLIGSGIGGAFGGKEDISVQIHCGMLALATGRPVKMVYPRDESFLGHPHRHPARMEYEHRATRDGRLVGVRARIVLDGGAYASTSSAVVRNAGALSVGPYDIPNLHVDCLAVYTNNPPAGSMRGMGVTQVCFGYEAQMNRLAKELNMDPLELRLRNALTDGASIATGQKLRGRAPVVEIVRRLGEMPVGNEPRGSQPDSLLPGGVSNTTHGEGVQRGMGYAIGIKGFCFSEGRQESSTALVRLSAPDGIPLVEVCSAAAEMGQGVVEVQIQVARSELQIENVVAVPAGTAIGPSGSSSASRQTFMTGGAVALAARAIRKEIFERARKLAVDGSELSLTPRGVESEKGLIASIPALLDGEQLERTAVYEPRSTEPVDGATGQGEAFISFMFSGHRAIVDVDTELGLVRVVELATVQDVGRIMDRHALEGQIEGGSAQGLGLAVMEEIRTEGGRILNGSFTDYLIPTTMDMPPVISDILEFNEPDGILGAKGAGEAPTVTSGAAVVAAIEDATGRSLRHIPARRDEIVGSALDRWRDR